MTTERITREKFRSRLRQQSSTPIEDRKACEYCNSPAISKRGTGYSDGDGYYRCNNCGYKCDGSGDATLETLDPEEVDERDD